MTTQEINNKICKKANKIRLTPIQYMQLQNINQHGMVDAGHICSKDAKNDLLHMELIQHAICTGYYSVTALGEMWLDISNQ